MTSLLSSSLACFALGATAFAGDWYVDAANGNDANTGIDAAHAWKTISHSLAATQLAGIQTIHVAPGTYGLALGETFPLNVQSDHRLIGEAGAASTVVDALGAPQSSAFVLGSSQFSQSGGISSNTRIQGFSIRNANVGVELVTSFGPITPSLADLDVSGCGVGVSLLSAGGLGGTLDVPLSNVRAHAGGVGLALEGHGPFTVRATATDSRFDHNASDGASLTATSCRLVLDRCRVEQNGASGIRSDSSGPVGHQLDVTDSLFASNAADGLTLVAGGLTGTNLHATHVTVANNAQDGIGSSGVFDALTLSQCILFGNGDDLDSVVTATASYNDIGDGDFNGINHNFSADPLFVDAANGDFRVRWASPCTEAGDPATPIGGLDLAKNARPIDGDLDTAEKPDVGAFEFAPLFMVASGKLGTTLELQLWGPQGNATTVYFARKPLVAAQATPFGELDLNAAAMSVYRVTFVGANTPKKIVRPIPTGPAFAGLVFSFQALTDSAAAPQGKAYSNAVQLTLVP